MREDLMRAFLMMTESDGMNAFQLLRWANLDTYLARYMEHQLMPIHEAPEMPRESEETALFLSLSWLCLDYRA